MIKPSKNLNNNSLILGLDTNDIISLTAVVCTLRALGFYNKDSIFWLALFGILFLILSYIRLNFRRRFLRDYIEYLILRILCSHVISGFKVG